MRKLMEMVDRIDDEVAYMAAKLYLTAADEDTKPKLARKLSEMANIDSPTAMMIIDAIDAYEDIRKAPDQWNR